MMPAGQLAIGRARTVRPFAEGESTSSPTVWELERAVSDDGRLCLVTILSQDSSPVPDLTIFFESEKSYAANVLSFLPRLSYEGHPLRPAARCADHRCVMAYPLAEVDRCRVAGECRDAGEAR